MIDDDMIDKIISDWYEQTVEERKLAQGRQDQRRNTVINIGQISNGDSFLLDGRTWVVEQIIEYKGHSAARYNQSLLIVHKAKGKRPYTIPHRVNGNLELRTLHPIPDRYLKYLTNTDFKWMEADYPPDVVAIYNYTGYGTEGRLSITDKNTYIIDSPPYSPDDYEEGEEQLIPRPSFKKRFIWAVRCGGGIVGDYYGGPATEDMGEWPHATNKRCDDGEFWIEFLDVDPTLVESVQSREKLAGTRKKLFYPDDIDRTAKAMLQHFEPDALIEAIRKLSNK